MPGSERGVYVRFGSTNRSVDAEMLDSLRHLAKKITYDELPHPEGHLDTEVMKNVSEGLLVELSPGFFDPYKTFILAEPVNQPRRT